MLLSTAARISLFYALYYACMGVHLPGMQAWYQAQGVTATQLGALGFITILARVVTSPAVGSWVDRRGHARRVAAILGWLTVAVFALNLTTQDFWPLLAIAIVFTIFRSPVGPLGDALALLACQREKLDFGRMRFWGSVAFMALAVASGPLIDRLGVDSVVWMSLGLFVVAALGSHLLPPDTAPPHGARPQAPVRYLLRQPVVLVFLVSSSFTQASHAVLYAFSTWHWSAVGLSQSQIGWLWGVSTTMELLLLWYSRHLIARLSPATLLILGALTAIPRWTFHALATDFWSFVALQLLHTGSFGFAYLGAIQFIVRTLPASHAASAQTLHAGANALLMGIAMWALGPVFTSHGGLVYLAMAAFGVIAALAGLWLMRLQRRP